MDPKQAQQLQDQIEAALYDNSLESYVIFAELTNKAFDVLSDEQLAELTQMIEKSVQ